MSGVFENTLCSTPYQGDYLATASSTADAMDLAQTAALIEREGLRFDGSAGATLTASISGANSFSFISLLSSQIFTGYHVLLASSANGLVIYRDAGDSTLRVTLDSGATFISVSDSFLSSRQRVFLSGTYDGATFRLYADGTLYGSNTVTATIAANTLRLGAGGASLTDSPWLGLVTGFKLWNYALTAAEIAALTRRGLVTLPEQRGGSMTALNTSAFTNLNMNSFSGASATGFTSSATGNQFAQSNPAITSKVSQKFLAVFSATVTGAATTIYLNQGSNTVAITNGSNSVVLTATANGSGAVIFNQVGTGTLVVSGFSIIPLGTLFEQDSGQRNAGYMVRDTSGNNADLILPASGVSVIDPAMRGTIRFTTNTAANQQIGGSQVIIPTNARITSWTINSSGTPNVTLGNVSAGAQYRALAPVVSGNNAITLLTPFTATGNLWCTSSTTDTLKHTIQWEYIQ